MNEKEFKFDIPKKNRDKIEELTNKPVKGTKHSTYNVEQPYLKDAYEGRINQKELEKKRQEYIDKAILEVVKENKRVIDSRKAMLKRDDFSKEKIEDDLWESLAHDIKMKLEHVQNTKKLPPSSYEKEGKELREHWHEFPIDIVRKRFLEWNFLDENEIPKSENFE